jgi:hypothetical protein
MKPRQKKSMSIQVIFWPQSQICLACENGDYLGEDNCAVCMINIHPDSDGKCKHHVEQKMEE